MRHNFAVGLAAVSLLVLAGCGDSSKLPEQASHGPNPTIPEPTKTLIPTVNVAKAIGWPEGAKPKAANDMTVNAFANGLDHPRWVYVLPNGEVLVAESNAPPKPTQCIKYLLGSHDQVCGGGEGARGPRERVREEGGAKVLPSPG